MGKLLLKKRDSPKISEEDQIIEALEIDKHNLDEENTHQANLMAKISKIRGQKHTQKYLLELELSILKDQLGEDIKANPKKWGIPVKESKFKKGVESIPAINISETMIDRMIVRNTRYQELFKKYAEAKGEDQEWEGMLKACEQKAWSLKSLENLWEKGYYPSKGK